MRITRIDEAQSFEPVGHTGVRPVRLQGDDATPTEAVTVVLSHYLPGGDAEESPQPAETIYVMVVGELVFTSDGQQARLGPMDSAHFTVGTVRSVKNESDAPATMLVIRAKS